MNTQFSIVSEGNPIIPYGLEVSFPVNHSAQYVEELITNHAENSQEFADLFATRAAFVEDSVKTIPEFSTQDTTRNVTHSVAFKSGPDGNGYNSYDLTINFTIENAEATISAQAQTELAGADRDAFLQTKANDAASEFFSGRPWTPLP